MNWTAYLQNLQHTSKPSNAMFLLGVQCLAFKNFQYFVDTFFPKHCRHPFSEMHHDFFEAEQIPDRRSRHDVIAAPRGHAKTTFKVIFKVIHAIVYGYEPFIVIIGRTKEDARAKVVEILEELESNRLLQDVYGRLLPKGGKRSGSFTTTTGVTVIAKSRGQSLRGLNKNADRPTLIICDDIESLEETMSLEQREKTWEWFTKDILHLGQTDGSTNITVIGTCLHPDSLLEKLLKVPGWNGVKYQAVKSFSNRADLWQEYTAIYTNLTEKDRAKEAQAFLMAHYDEMMDGVELLWPEAESYERLMQMRINDGEAAFLSEKQNIPWDPSRTIFDMDHARRFKVVREHGHLQGLQWLDGSERFIPKEDIVKIIAFHDPVPGKSISGDFAAIVVVALDRHGYMYCLDAWLGRENPNTQVQHAFALHRQWRLNKLYLEENNFQGLIKTIYYENNQKHSNEDLLFVEGFRSMENKTLRISSMEPYITNGLVLFADSLSPLFIDQLKLYPSNHDDGPDALQGAIAQLKQPNIVDLYQALI